MTHHEISRLDHRVPRRFGVIKDVEAMPTVRYLDDMHSRTGGVRRGQEPVYRRLNFDRLAPNPGQRSGS